MIGTAVGLIGLAGVTVAWALGAFEPERTASAEPIDRTGMLAFPALAQPVPAFEAISRVHLINKRTRSAECGLVARSYQRGRVTERW